MTNEVLQAIRVPLFFIHLNQTLRIADSFHLVSV